MLCLVCVIVYAHINILKKKTKRAQAKLVYCGKKEKKKEANEQYKLSNNCENIIKIY